MDCSKQAATSVCGSQLQLGGAGDFARVNFRLDCRELREVGKNCGKFGENRAKQLCSKRDGQLATRTNHTKRAQKGWPNGGQPNNPYKQSAAGLASASLASPKQRPRLTGADGPEVRPARVQMFKSLQFDSMRERLFRLLSKVPLQVETIKRRSKRRPPPPPPEVSAEATRRAWPDAGEPTVGKCSDSPAAATSAPKTAPSSQEPLVIKYYHEHALAEILELHFACSLLTPSNSAAADSHQAPAGQLLQSPSSLAPPARAVQQQQQPQPQQRRQQSLLFAPGERMAGAGSGQRGDSLAANCYAQACEWRPQQQAHHARWSAQGEHQAASATLSNELGDSHELAAGEFAASNWPENSSCRNHLGECSSNSFNTSLDLPCPGLDSAESWPSLAPTGWPKICSLINLLARERQLVAAA